jgi:hypothetical protein
MSQMNETREIISALELPCQLVETMWQPEVFLFYRYLESACLQILSYGRFGVVAFR